MARRSTLRASDADREQFAERLRDATTEGRLIADELEQRLGAVFSARTYGELDATVADLPTPPRPRRRKVTPARVGLTLAIALAVLAVIAVLAMALLAFAGAWFMWIVIGWFFFGRHSHYGRRGRRGMCSVSRASRSRLQSG